MDWAICFGISWLHLAAVNVATLSVSGNIQYAASALLLAPAAITLWKVASSRPSWWRWLILFVLLGLTTGQAAMLILVSGQAALIRRFWVSEHKYGYRWLPAAEPASRPVGRSASRTSSQPAGAGR